MAKAKKVKKILKAKKVSKKVSKLATDNYLATLSVGGVDYKGEGNTPFEACKGIEIPKALKILKGNIILQKGKQKAERFLSGFQVRKFTRGSKLNRLATAKLLTLLLK
jgi:hypothetical protein